MAITAEMKNIYNDVKKYGTANWNMSALTSDGKVINRCWCGFVLKWIPNAIIPSWLKCKLTNANITLACPKARENLKALVTYYKKETDPKTKEAIKVDYTKAIENLNLLMEKVNCKRPDTAKLTRFEPQKLDARRRKTTTDGQSESAKKTHQMSMRGDKVLPNRFRPEAK